MSVEAKVASKMVKRENGVVWHQKKREPFAKPEKHVFGQKSIWPKKNIVFRPPPLFPAKWTQIGENLQQNEESS